MTIHHLDSINNSLRRRLFFHLLIYKLIDKILGSFVILLDSYIQ